MSMVNRCCHSFSQAYIVLGFLYGQTYLHTVYCIFLTIHIAKLYGVYSGYVCTVCIHFLIINLNLDTHLYLNLLAVV